jgi:hypothetical protein
MGVEARDFAVWPRTRIVTHLKTPFGDGTRHDDFTMNRDVL